MLDKARTDDTKEDAISTPPHRPYGDQLDGCVEHGAEFTRPDDPIVFGRRWLEALRAIRRHADYPAGESWEQAYAEVTTMAREALGDAI